MRVSSLRRQLERMIGKKWKEEEEDSEDSCLGDGSEKKNGSESESKEDGSKKFLSEEDGKRKRR